MHGRLAKEAGGPSPAAAVTQPSALPAFVKFVLVGGLAFAVNEAALFLLYDTSLLWFLPARDSRADFLFFAHPDVRLLMASVLSVQAAIAFKFFGHEHWTFAARPRRRWIGIRFLSFNVSCIASSAISVLTVNILTPVFDLSPYIATAAGVWGGFLSNWVFSAHLVWPHHATPAPAAEEA